MKNLTRTSEELQEARQRVNEKINTYIAELQAKIREAENYRDGVEVPEAPQNPNRLQDLLKSIENKSKVTEVTAYRVPTPKKEYKYTPPKTGDLIGTDKDGNPVYF
jgi:hypothetical protein